MAKEVKEDSFFPDGGLSVLEADILIARIGVDTITSINSKPEGKFADKVHGRILYYPGKDMRFLYADKRNGSPYKVIIPIAAIKHIILE